MRRNADVDWDAWPVADYLAENYRVLHRADEAVIDHHSAVYARLGPDTVDRSVEFGAGPNLYPLALAAAASRLVHAVERSAAGVAYLRGQLRAGPDSSWDPFYARCRLRNPALPPALADALSRVRVTRADAATLPAGRYGLASMNFVAESVTEDRAEFGALCRAFIHCVRPGGQLVAAFMENMGRYSINGGRSWPGVPVDSDAVAEVFAPHVTGLAVRRIDADPALPDWGYTGMILLAAHRAT
ncbi:class I SAM-dependent methyltransferase [Phytohabitans rumicis]|uniref:Methyltransferase n=1 Tax=Phytohabitans rumicis TaxID=1076125 RepID=A0A6V8LAK3_9ACTN|nr:class I SAM-dependent methyltransferase [Phytohabitans rumicis]GFJ94242.1 hypothetical protein Prum_078840 [Phytohabitans rumicis]